MPTPITVGTEIKEIDLLQILPPDEGEINQIYGRIGSGKTYCATKDIIKDLNRGQIWYTNWKIKWDGYDQRNNKFLLLLRSLGFNIKFKKYDKENLHYVDLYDLQNISVDGKQTGKDFISWLSTITDAKLAFDEGHIAFNSYEKTRINMDRINAVMWARHFDRTYLIISQRPSAIHITLRANVNRFFKCEKIVNFKLGKIHLQQFKKTEFQDTTENDTPNEEKIKKLNERTHMIEETEKYQYAISEKTYWGRKKYFEAYDTKYRRQQLGTSQPNYAHLYGLTQAEAWKTLIKWNKEIKRTGFKKNPIIRMIENKNKLKNTEYFNELSRKNSTTNNLQNMQT